MDKRLETVKCNLCDAVDGTLLYEMRDRIVYAGIDSSQLFKLIRCPNCGLVYVNPRVSSAALHTLYREGLPGPNNITGEIQSRRYEFYQRVGQEKLAFYRSEISRVNSRVQPPGRLLEVGCAYGHFLVAAKETGWDVYGVELDRLATRCARETLGLTDHILESSFEEAGFPDGFFDVVVLLEVTEHLTDPQGTLRKINSVLRKGGLMVATFPNVDSIPRFVQGASWAIFHPVEHVYYFNVPTMKVFLDKTGFSFVSTPARVRSGQQFRNLAWRVYAPFYDVSVKYLNWWPRSALEAFASKVRNL